MHRGFYQLKILCSSLMKICDFCFTENHRELHREPQRMTQKTTEKFTHSLNHSFSH